MFTRETKRIYELISCLNRANHTQKPFRIDYKSFSPVNNYDWTPKTFTFLLSILALL